MSRCKTCVSVQQADYYKRRPPEVVAKHNASTGKWSASHSKQRHEQDVKQRRLPARKRYHHIRELRLKYGVSEQEYDAMLIAQGGRCKICGGISTGRGLGIDHDHATGKIRGLLCVSCNAALGLAHDNPELLRNMALYVEYNKVS
jgi:hypothetical protein